MAESVFIAGLFVLAAKELAAIARQRGLAAEAEGYMAEAARWTRPSGSMAGMASGSCAPTTISAARSDRRSAPKARSSSSRRASACWRASGSRTGWPRRRSNPCANIWPRRMASCCSSPPIRAITSHLGEISSYPPGYKENAGIFCHNNPWVIIAEAMAGNGDGAHDYYSRINPSAREAISDVHRCEPYVYAQMIAGRDAPTHGEAKNSWLTGTAAWNYYAIVQWILGIRPAYDGLADRAGDSSAMGGFPRGAPIPRRDLQHRRAARRAGQCGEAGRGWPFHRWRHSSGPHGRAGTRCP